MILPGLPGGEPYAPTVNVPARLLVEGTRVGVEPDPDMAGAQVMRLPALPDVIRAMLARQARR